MSNNTNNEQSNEDKIYNELFNSIYDEIYDDEFYKIFHDNIKVFNEYKKALLKYCDKIKEEIKDYLLVFMKI